MKSKLKILVIIIGIIILFIAVRACNNKISNVIRDDIDKETQSLEVGDEVKIKDWDVKIYNLLIGDIKYEQLPLSKKFLIKFKDVEDIIPGKAIGFLAADSDKFDITRDQDKNICSISSKTGNGFEEIAYQLHYVINDKNELDDIEILDSKKIIDEIGNAVRYDKYMFYSDCDYACGLLIRPYNNIGDYLYVTDNFNKKYPNYEDEGVIPNTEYMIEEDLYKDKSNPNVCWALVMDLNNTKLYKLDVVLDEKGYVDDVIITLDKVTKTEDPQYVQDVYDEYYS